MPSKSYVADFGEACGQKGGHIVRFLIKIPSYKSVNLYWKAKYKFNLPGTPPFGCGPGYSFRLLCRESGHPVPHPHGWTPAKPLDNPKKDCEVRHTREGLIKSTSPPMLSSCNTLL